MLVWHLNTKELAQWTPSFLDLVDQKPFWWDTLLDLLIVALEGLDGVISFLEPPVEIPLPYELGDRFTQKWR